MSSVTDPWAAYTLRERELRFIENARRTFNLIYDREFWDKDFPQGSSLVFAESAYHEGFHVLRIITGTWTEFFGFLNREYGFWTWRHGEYYQRNRRSLSSAWYFRHGSPEFREKISYRRKPHHKPKAENPKQAWRDHKQFKRDKSARGWRRMDKAGPWGKRQVSQTRRHHDKRMIQAERFDEVCPHNRGTKRIWWD